MAEIYEMHADEYDRLVGAEDFQGNLSAYLMRSIAREGRQVLEGGVGTGRVTRIYVGRVASVLCVDRSSHMLRAAKRRLREFSDRIEFLQGDNERLPNLDRPRDLYIEGWSRGHSIGSSAVDIRATTESHLANVEKNLVPAGAVILIETLGTNVLRPVPPHPRLSEFYRLLVEDEATGTTCCERTIVLIHRAKRRRDAASSSATVWGTTSRPPGGASSRNTRGCGTGTSNSLGTRAAGRPHCQRPVLLFTIASAADRYPWAHRGADRAPVRGNASGDAATRDYSPVGAQEGRRMERDDVELAAMGEADFELFLDRVVEDYASQSVAAGRVEEAGSREWARSETGRLLPDGLRTRGAILLRITTRKDPSTTLGTIWCAPDPSSPKSAFVYDLFVYPDHRGHGVAFAAMSKLEVLLRAEGFEAVGLHVYAHNEVAVNLYEKLRYRTSSMVLRKNLT